MRNRFENPDFLEWTNGIVVNVHDFNNLLIKKFDVPVYDLDPDVYDREYDEYLWRWYEREHVFNSFKEAEEYAETVLYNEYVSGQPIYCYYTGNKKAGYQYIMTLTENNKPKGWRLYEL